MVESIIYICSSKSNKLRVGMVSGYQVILTKFKGNVFSMRLLYSKKPKG